MKIVCKRADEAITFSHSLPYWLKSVEGLGEADYDVSSEKAADQDGELYKGATANKRNIVVKATIIPPDGTTHDQIREAFFAFFVPRETGTLYFYDGDKSRKIDYKAENCEFEMDGIFRDVTISLVCPDPIFRAVQDETADAATVEGLIEWPVELPEEFEVGIRYEVRMATIINRSSVSRGMTITFTASGEVVNPGLVEVNRQLSFRILTTMHTGETIVITTGPNNKRVKLITGDGAETNINNLWEFGGTWLQVEPGENVYTFTTDGGDNALSVNLASTPQYWGV